MNQLIHLSQRFQLPAVVKALPESGWLKFWEFFTAQIRNPNPRRSYAKAAMKFLR
jgi:hypothetical protein